MGPPSYRILQTIVKVDTKSAFTQNSLQFAYTDGLRIDLLLYGKYSGFGGGFTCLGSHGNDARCVPCAAFGGNDAAGRPHIREAGDIQRTVGNFEPISFVAEIRTGTDGIGLWSIQILHGHFIAADDMANHPELRLSLIHI